jgi:hypothetical protein
MSKKLLFKGEVRTGKFDYTTGAFERWLGALNFGHFLALAFLSKENTSINPLHIELIVILVIILSWLIFIRLSGVKRY